MSAVTATFPEAVFLRRPDETGYGFFFHGEEDFRHAADSFSKPVLQSFAGEPVPGQPDPQEHLKVAIATFIGQAFDKAVPDEVGAEGISRAIAACIRHAFKGSIPRVVVVEHKKGRISLRPGIEFMRHPGHPLAVVVDADAHGGEARFFSSVEHFRKVGESEPNPRCWLPQIVYRLYDRTPSVIAGRPSVDRTTGKHNVECRGLSFGVKAPLEERPTH
ncbi:hypothetical protein [Telmatospirillum siberiense]|uniref:Uncharacterized protein n=1 Tax=Telmatospirillum siberiense TaxID=382514 RepID=A0A2N3PPB2_9PROT|nr:hypothetical protein [Telmatospirillum siberiense]PKU22216.1 hypothetical protein CWS72_22965 [Telmatospirillum siberiense]